MTKEEARLILHDMYNSCIDGYTNLLAEDKEVPAMLIDDINALDMAIEALSNERPKGRWVCLEAEIGYYACSECDHRILRTKCNYCPNCVADMAELPNCGADMREIENE